MPYILQSPLHCLYKFLTKIVPLHQMSRLFIRHRISLLSLSGLLHLALDYLQGECIGIAGRYGDIDSAPEEHISEKKMEDETHFLAVAAMS